MFHWWIIMFHWWTAAHTLAPYQARRQSKGLFVADFCFPAQFKWLPAYSAWQCYNFPSMLNLLHWKFHWLGFDCLWTCSASIFQRWKLILSFWQHCYSTNKPDGLFRPSALGAREKFSHAKHKTACIVLCRWGFHWGTIAQTHNDKWVCVKSEPCVDSTVVLLFIQFYLFIFLWCVLNNREEFHKCCPKVAHS